MLSRENRDQCFRLFLLTQSQDGVALDHFRVGQVGPDRRKCGAAERPRRGRGGDGEWVGGRSEGFKEGEESDRGLVVEEDGVELAHLSSGCVRERDATWRAEGADLDKSSHLLWVVFDLSLGDETTVEEERVCNLNFR